MFYSDICHAFINRQIVFIIELPGPSGGAGNEQILAACSCRSSFVSRRAAAWCVLVSLLGKKNAFYPLQGKKTTLKFLFKTVLTAELRCAS